MGKTDLKNWLAATEESIFEAETKMIETPLKHKFDNKMISIPAIMEDDQPLKTEALVEHDTLRIYYDRIKTSSKS